MRSRRRRQVATASRLRNSIARAHVAIYRRTNGRVLGKIGSQPLMLLTTRGRKTGGERMGPVGYLKEGNRYVIVALGPQGSPRHPAWYLNLNTVTVHVKDQMFEAGAETANPEQQARLWPLLVEQYSGSKLQLQHRDRPGVAFPAVPRRAVQHRPVLRGGSDAIGCGGADPDRLGNRRHFRDARLIRTLEPHGRARLLRNQSNVAPGFELNEHPALLPLPYLPSQWRP